MTAKNCTQCKELKPLPEFNKDKTLKSGIRSACRTCCNKATRKYKLTKNGLICNIYKDQRLSSRKRDHPMPDYSLNELREWALNQDVFHEIYNNWAESGHKKMSRPSFDRINDYRSYTLDNIRIITWSENFNRGNSDRKKGINNKTNKSVLQYTKNKELIDTHHSMRHASRVTGISSQNITSCCLGKRKTAGGYIWENSY